MENIEQMNAIRGEPRPREPDATERASPSAPAGTDRAAPPLAAGSRIAYTQTKTVRLLSERLRAERIIAGSGRGAVADAYKVLRTQVLQRMRANQWNTLVITSPTEGNGKTLTAINLAISLARNVDNTVLLVDLDLLQPGLYRYLAGAPVPGLSDYLMGRNGLSDVLIHPGIERLVILPGNEPFAHSSEILSSPAFVQLVEELKTRYPDRLVLFDMPPMLACDDVLAFSPYVDAVMLVVEEGKTTKDELRRCYELLEHTNILGTVLNKADVTGSAVGSY